ncbi:GPN-loop GTPase 1 [Phlyctochytrium bullatum]|nr:GPN-loop GTPase 1 [Phlyctochytrium bullatum]
MKQYTLGPNGAILTALNLFTTKFDQVLEILSKRAPKLEYECIFSRNNFADSYVLFDTPGQIEIFTWSASGAIITDTVAATYPACIAYIIDTPRSSSPVTFMSNMLYAVSILYKTRLPFILVFNKTDVVSHDFAVEWMTDFEAFQAAVREDTTYMGTLVNSMCLVVGVSAATGAGMDEFLNAVDDAAEEYYRDYKPQIDAMMKEKQKAARKAKEENLEKLLQDMEISGGHGGDEIDFETWQGSDNDEQCENDGEPGDVDPKQISVEKSLKRVLKK